MKGIPKMKLRLYVLLALCCALVINLSLSRTQKSYSQTTKATPKLSQIEMDLVNEINQARAQPQVYAGYLEKLKPLFKGKEYTVEGQPALQTQEGWAAVEDAIQFLRTSKPLGPLTMSQGLCLAAFSHVKDQSASGATGHAGADKTMIEQRVKPFGSWEGGIGENLVYGNESAREQILTWLIDDGVATRGHRKRLMSQDYKVFGISCGPHPEFGTMCVLTLAGGFRDSPIAQKPATANKPAATLSNGAANANSSVGAPANSNSKTSNSSGGVTNANKRKSRL
jgi:uncharacterized protein YkwD